MMVIIKMILRRCCCCVTLLGITTAAFLVVAVTSSRSSPSSITTAGAAFVVSQQQHHHQQNVPTRAGSSSTSNSRIPLLPLLLRPGRRRRTRRSSSTIGRRRTTSYSTVFAGYGSNSAIFSSSSNNNEAGTGGVDDAAEALRRDGEDNDDEEEGSAASKLDDDDNTKKKGAMEVLIFGAKLNYTSELFPANTTKQDFVDFFERLDTKNLLLGSGGKHEVKRLEVTPQLLELWKSACDKYYGSKYMPTSSSNDDDDQQNQNNNEIYASESIVKFPGLKVITTVCSAVKVNVDSASSTNGDDLPSYDFILIGENRRAEGPLPILWIYNQLTGADKNSKDNEFNPSQASARTRVSVVRHDEGIDDDDDDNKDNKSNDESNESKYGFNFDMRMNVRVEFPRLLVKILPTSREKMEQQGSNSVYNAVQPDIVQAITATRTSFLKYITTDNEMNE